MIDDDDDEIGLRMRTRKQETRRFFALLGVLIILMGCVFGYFSWVQGVHLNADLWLRVDNVSKDTRHVLVEAETRNPQTGETIVLDHVSLEYNTNGAVVSIWPVLGNERRMLPVGGEPSSLSIFQRHPVLGEMRAQVNVSTLDAGASRLATRPLRGGAHAEIGTPGIRQQRVESSCGWTMRVLAQGGVPVANIENEFLIRVIDGDGQPLAGQVLSVHGLGVDTLRFRTDARGMAIVSAVAPDLAMLLVEGICGGEPQRAAFEIQSAFDGLSILELDATGDDFVAKVENLSTRAAVRYDLRCGGEVISYGRVAKGGWLRVPAQDMASVREGQACRVQVYRNVFDTYAPHAIQVFQWHRDDLGWVWQQTQKGLGLIGLERVERTFPDRDDELVRWKTQRHGWIRRGMIGVILVSLLGWTVLVFRSRTQDVDDEDSRSGVGGVWVNKRTLQLLILGYGGVICAFGGLFVVMWLMGL